MKITMENAISLYRSSMEQGENKKTVSDKGRIARSKDRVVISADSRKVAEHEFARSIASRLSEEVKGNTPEQKLQTLEGKIQAGDYRIEASEIAGRMMLLAEGEE